MKDIYELSVTKGLVIDNRTISDSREQLSTAISTVRDWLKVKQGKLSTYDALDTLLRHIDIHHGENLLLPKKHLDEDDILERIKSFCLKKTCNDCGQHTHCQKNIRTIRNQWLKHVLPRLEEELKREPSELANHLHYETRAELKGKLQTAQKKLSRLREEYKNLKAENAALKSQLNLT